MRSSQSSFYQEHPFVANEVEMGTSLFADFSPTDFSPADFSTGPTVSPLKQQASFFQDMNGEPFTVVAQNVY
jgi:hypothetical protein